MTLIDGSIPAILAALDALRDPEARERAFLDHVIASSGQVILPSCGTSGGSTWGSHMVELSLQGIIGLGHDVASALADWMKAARRTVALNSRLATAETVLRNLQPGVRISDADLRDACQTIRVHSTNFALIAIATRVDIGLTIGGAKLAAEVPGLIESLMICSTALRILIDERSMFASILPESARLKARALTPVIEAEQRIKRAQALL